MKRRIYSVCKSDLHAVRPVQSTKFAVCLFIFCLCLVELYAQSGKVGIGIESPGSLLHLFSTANGSRGISIGAQGTLPSQQAYLELITEGDGTAKLGAASNKGWHIAARGAAYGGISQQNDLLIANWNGFNWSGNMFFETTGNIGIGTSFPLAKLHVHGDMVSTDTLNTITPADPPVSGAGTRMMWYGDKAAFRAGNVDGVQWDKDSIGFFSAAIGKLVKAKGDNATAFGVSTSASGNSATALGGSTSAIGINSVAMGLSSSAIGVTSTAMGSSTTALGWYSTSLGIFSSADAYASVALGRFNVGGGNDATWIDTDPLFEIGMGSGPDSAERANALTILKNGNAGIGTASPSTLLHIKRGIGSGDPTSDLIDACIEDDFAYLEFSGDLFGGVTFKDDGTSIRAGMLFDYQNDRLRFRTGDTDYLSLDESGNLGLIAGGKLGIGTSSPFSQLHIKNFAGAGNPTSADVDLVLEDINAYMEISATDLSGYTFLDDGVSLRAGMMHNYTDDALRFHTNGVARLTITDNGNVGIGTVSPQERLHVEGTIEVDNKIQANNSGGLELATDEGTVRLKILDNGNVGVNETNPQAALHVDGGATKIRVEGSSSTLGVEYYNGPTFGSSMGHSITNDYLFLYNDGNVIVKDGEVGIGTTSVPTAMLHIKQVGSGEEALAFENDGNANIWSWEIGTNDLSLYFNGTQKAYVDDTDGSWNLASDRRLKTGIRYSDQPVLGKILKLKPASYKYIGNDSESVGFIAQDVQHIFPQLVKQREDGYLALNYSAFSVYSIKATQELAEKVQALESEIEELRAIVRTLLADQTQ